MGGINYKELYKLQDEVLEVVFAAERIFYLTGGTCLSRFYQEKRYSDDLDLFAHDEHAFVRTVREITSMLKDKFTVKEEINTKDFIRLLVNDMLQVDLVLDRTPRIGEPIITNNGYMIDTIENILANKFTAVIGRDNPKDMFDIFLVDKFYDIDYGVVLDGAHQKASFDDDELIVRLKGFPTEWLKKISLVDNGFLSDFDAGITSVISKIENRKT